jgi:hypothetical protein
MKIEDFWLWCENDLLNHLYNSSNDNTYASNMLNNTKNNIKYFRDLGSFRIGPVVIRQKRVKTSKYFYLIITFNNYYHDSISKNKIRFRGNRLGHF